MSFELIPAIDLLGGACVRLSQGRYDAATVYERDPGAMAGRFAAHPIQRLHVVDLDGAREGRRVNDDALHRIVEAAAGVPVQLGGGLRDAESIAAALDLGVDRVVLGTVALREPELVKQAALLHPGRIVVGIDAREGRVAVEGWLEASDVDALELARRFEDAGVAALVYTDIARDGVLAGPNLEATVALSAALEIPVILSGGVSCIADLRAAAEPELGLAGAIVGRALYTGAIDLAEALAALGDRAC